MPRRIAGFVAGLVLFSACGQGRPTAFTTQSPLTPTTMAAAAFTGVAFTGAGFELHAVAPVSKIAVDGAWAGALATLNRYLEAAVLVPLRTGGPAGDLTPLLTGPAFDRVRPGGPDRFVFIDENLPPLGDLRSEAAVAELAGLAGGDGLMAVVTARVDLRLDGHAEGAPVSVTRTGDLVLVPAGGAWVIDAYDLTVVRTHAQLATRATAISTTPAKP